MPNTGGQRQTGRRTAEGCTPEGGYTPDKLIRLPVTLQAKNLYDSGYWNTSQWSAYQATFAFAYILTGTFLIMFLVLLLGRGSLNSGDAYEAKGPAG